MLSVEKLIRSLEAYEQWKKKKAEPLDQVIPMEIKDEKAQNTQVRGQERGIRKNGREGRRFGQDGEKEQSGQKNMDKHLSLWGSFVRI